MFTEDTDKLCDRWIVEFDCRRMWTAFSQLDSFDGTMNHAGSTYYQLDANNSQSPWNNGDCKTDGYRLLVCFMSRISDAVNGVSAIGSGNDDTTRQTSLDEAIALLEHIYRRFSGVLEHGEVEDVQLSLKRHAVLAPLRKSDRTKAKAVFDRQWIECKTVDEARCQSKLATMTDSPLNQLPSFNEVIARCQEMLEKIMSSLPRPFLLEVAQRVNEKVESNSANVQFSSSPVAKSSPTKSSAELRVQRTNITGAMKFPEKQSTQPNAAVAPKRRKTTDHSPSTSFAVSKVPEIKTSDELGTDGTDSEDWWNDEPPKSKCTKKVKKTWSSNEEEQVYKGVKAHGVGNWALIHANYLQNRTNVDIKDKWRTMLRQGRLKELERQFGPLPVI